MLACNVPTKIALCFEINGEVLTAARLSSTIATHLKVKKDMMARASKKIFDSCTIAVKNESAFGVF